MKKLKIQHTFLLLCFYFVSVNCFSQESVHTLGHDASGAGGSAAYSVGQVAYTSVSTSNGSVAQGVQQAYEIFSVGKIETIEKYSFSIFPIPTSNALNLKISGKSSATHTYQLADMNGRVLIAETIYSDNAFIDISLFPPSVYLLTIFEGGNRKVQSFKIIKK